MFSQSHRYVNPDGWRDGFVGSTHCAGTRAHTRSHWLELSHAVGVLGDSTPGFTEIDRGVFSDVREVGPDRWRRLIVSEREDITCSVAADSPPEIGQQGLRLANEA